jgi:hypothetical protein
LTLTPQHEKCGDGGEKQEETARNHTIDQDGPRLLVTTTRDVVGGIDTFCEHLQASCVRAAKSSVDKVQVSGSGISDRQQLHIGLCPRWRPVNKITVIDE